jgi:mono/diheme cytochrome c family protein
LLILKKVLLFRNTKLFSDNEYSQSPDRAAFFARLVLATGFALLAAFAAAAEIPPPVDRPVDFSRDVQPIFASRCVVCHGASQMGGLRLDRRDDAMRGGTRGPAILAGDSASSPLIRFVAGADDKIVMPPAGERLNAEQIGILRAWIDGGAEWGDEPATAGSGNSSHWAFQPIRKPIAPQVKDTAWVRNEIDAFILRRLEEKKIAPSPSADRRTLARRLSFDLTGLPPSPEQLRRFLADQRDGAYESYVDTLLDSPRFAEHWARYWLDLARYADSDGYRGDRFRPNAWRWRQWVIEAINRDMPFDQFTIEQIAGDLLPNATIDQRVATGFHRNTLTNREGGIDPEQFRVEQVYDRISTIGVVWLGLTVQCAQCHDHKFDPIPQRDF